MRFGRRYARHLSVLFFTAAFFAAACLATPAPARADRISLTLKLAQRLSDAVLETPVGRLLGATDEAAAAAGRRHLPELGQALSGRIGDAVRGPLDDALSAVARRLDTLPPEAGDRGRDLASAGATAAAAPPLFHLTRR